MTKIISMKKIINISILFLSAISLISCGDNDPSFQFMPDMYEPVGYETYGEYDVFEDGQEAKLPAEGSIPRGWSPYDYENTPEGKAKATAELKNPLELSEDNLGAGNRLYTIYCAVCHGDTGDGKGILATREKFLGIPSYADAGRNITEGDVYHVQMYGINSMGSYVSQTNEEERWQITQHVMNLKATLEGKPLSEPTKINDGTSPEGVTLSNEAEVAPKEETQSN